MRLDPDELKVTSFEASSASLSSGGGWCCTGCDSTCGIYPTAGGCNSSGKTYEYPECGLSQFPCESVDICEG